MDGVEETEGTEGMEAAERALGNHLIVGTALKNLGWRDLSECSRVCPLWSSVVRSLRKERPPQTYLFDAKRGEARVNRISRTPPSLSLLFSNNLIGLDTFDAHCDSERTVALISESVYEENFSLGGVSIPNIDGVGVRILSYPRANAANAANADHEELFQILSENFIKCVIAFTAHTNYSRKRLFISNVVSTIRERQPESPDVAVGGCLVNKMKRGERVHKSDAVIFIIFHVSRSPPSPVHFRAHSTIIETVQKDKIHRHIEKFSERAPLLRHGVAVKLTCVDRYYDDCDQPEKEALAKFFPGVPAVGCSAMGEIGRDDAADPSDGRPPPKRRLKDGEDIFYSGSTSLIILTWDDSKE